MNERPLVILAHAPSAQALADDVSAHLKALGFSVDALPRSRRAGALRLREAHRLVLLWSRDAARLLALRSAAKRAAARNMLTCVRADAAHPPVWLGGRAIAAPRGRNAGDVWRRLLQRAPEAIAATSAASVRTSRLSGVAAALAMAAVVGVALYSTDTAFAARVDQLAGVAQAHAADVVDQIKARVAG